MEPITTTLLTALIAGAAAAATDVTDQAIKDTYTGLKMLVVARLDSQAKVENALQQVEAKPDSPARQSVLKEELESAVASDPATGQDQALLTKAEKLLTLLREQGQPTDAAVHIVQSGSGGLAYGAGAKAAGERGVVANTIKGSVSTGNNARQIRSDSYIETQIIQQGAPKFRPPLERSARATHFQDRTSELEQLLADLQPGKVVTLSGPGGIGKSALAAEAIWRLAPDDAPPERFPDGIVSYTFTEAQRDVELVLEKIARRFGKGDLRPTPLDAAREALAGRRALLLLEATEQADHLEAILAIRDRCGVLVTSRTRRGAPADRQDIPPLPLQDAMALLQALGQKRAEDGQAVQRICELVGRLPFAVHLVGSYLNTNEIDASEYLNEFLEKTPLEALDLGERLQDSVPLLLAQSVAQVSDTARQALSGVGVLALAPFGRETIIAALGIAPAAAQDALGELVSYSLLVRGKITYEVSHALVHTYARERLSPPSDVVERLARHFTSWMKEQGPLSKENFAKLAEARPHILAVLAACRDHKQWEPAIELAAAVDEYLQIGGYWTERVAATQIGLLAARALQDREYEGTWLGYLGNAYRNLGQYEQAISYSKQALAFAREIGDGANEGTWLGYLGNAYRDLGQSQQAISYSEQALAIARKIGDRANEGAWLGNLGNAYRDLGQSQQAISYYEQALAFAREVGDRRNEGAWLGNLGNAYRDLGQIEQAIDFFQQALDIARKIGDRANEGNWLGGLGAAYADLGQYEQAISYSKQALAFAREIGDRRNEGVWLGSLGSAYLELGQSQQARQTWEQSLRILDEIKSPDAETLRGWLAELEGQ